MKTYKQYLIEASQYEDMFSKELENLIEKYLHFRLNRLLNDTKNSLKNKYVIIWFLRWIKISLLYHLDVRVRDKEEKDFINNEINKMHKKFRFAGLSTNELYDIFDDCVTYLDSFDHLYSMDIFKINEYRPDKNETIRDVLNLFYKYEREHISKLNSVIEDNGTWDVLIKFPNGWQWQALGKAFCSLEKDAMSHCANFSNANDPYHELLSLREPVKINNELFWRPWITCVYHHDKKGLSEIKGVERDSDMTVIDSNTTPDRKFHPYIIKLLEHDMVDHLLGPLWEHEDNFFLDDISTSEQNRLLSMKPELLSLGFIRQLFNGDISPDRFIEHYDLDSQVTGDSFVVSIGVSEIINDTILALLSFDDDVDSYKYILYDTFEDDNYIIKQMQDYFDTRNDLDAILDSSEDDPLIKDLRGILNINSDDIKQDLVDFITDNSIIHFTIGSSYGTDNSSICEGYIHDINGSELTAIADINEFMDNITKIYDEDEFKNIENDLKRYGIAIHHSSFIPTYNAELNPRIVAELKDTIIKYTTGTSLKDKIDYLNKQGDMFGTDNLDFYKDILGDV